MPVQGSVHNVQRAPHQTLGTRTRCRGRTDAARSEPASHACAPRNRRASVRHAEDADGCDALSDEDAAEGGDRDGVARTRLQPHARDEHRRYQTTSRGGPSVRSVYCCARRSRSLSAARGCAWTDSRLDTAKTCSDGRTDVNHARLRAVFEEIKNVFTRPGPEAVLLPMAGSRTMPSVSSAFHDPDHPLFSLAICGE